MIKKYKTINIILPAIQIAIQDIFKIIAIIKNHKLGIVHLYEEKDKKIKIKNISKEIIYHLEIEIVAREGKNCFKIIINKKGSYIQYYNEIDSNNLLKLLEIEEIIKRKKAFNVAERVSSIIGIINSLLLMVFLSLSLTITPAIQIIYPIYFDKTWAIIVLLTYLVAIYTITFLDFNGNTRIIVGIKNKFKRFYYKYYSINNFIRTSISSVVVLSIIILFSRFLNNRFN